VTSYGQSFNDSFLNVLGLDGRHDVLFYSAKSLARAHEAARNVVYARRSADIKRRLADGDVYDRVIVGDDSLLDMSPEALANLAKMNRGLLCFFVPSGAVEGELVHALNESWPFAEVQGFDTDIGRLVMCDAKGTSYDAVGKYDHAIVLR
jgi:hypothetical protein